VDIDFSYLTMYSGSGSTSLESTMGDTEGRGKGKTAGEMTGISIDSAGKIYASYSNSDLKLLGQIAVASFSNPSGLESIGDSLFKETQNSGRFNGV
ncbi:MAG: flagellar hook protein, partial [Lachnospiraceae bacterium]|nr:flagellar hook protein [Lachnospiraceae bacterium]